LRRGIAVSGGARVIRSAAINSASKPRDDLRLLACSAKAEARFGSALNGSAPADGATPGLGARACGDVEAFVEGRADDDVGVGIDLLADAGGGFVDLVEGEVLTR
jgi:hypothetical protein